MTSMASYQPVLSISKPENKEENQFDIYEAFQRILKDEQMSPPLAAILALTEVIENSNAGTMFELVNALKDGAEILKHRTPNPISLNAGCELFIAFVTLLPHDSANFLDLKRELIRQGEQYAAEALTYRQKIADLAVGFIKDGSVILTHSYSRVVMQTLLLAHKRKRISVFVTEARPRGLGIKTAEALTAAGIPCSVILDVAVAYVMDKVDFVLVGSEAVVESGGLINAVGSNQIAIIAKAANKPFYALAESYKFHRLFPLSQYDLPSHNSKILAFTQALQPDPPGLMGQNPADHSGSADKSQIKMSPGLDPHPPVKITQEQICQNNPNVDYTRPDLISLVFSDVGSLTPEGVSQYLVGMFAG
ncbi:nagb/rpia/CoA transferase-like protein [Macrolepiota fuliginosa MF-IS2]|uniref:Translation initiation factor eIF2B subunit alpha n=1 Tax=Macrolepiota fuliginosa MF-IS2 TaxID=1400762 RepID=A0A9P5XK66_9AGAR|nr:nagb/rpia/CoA transferase-like protein [Macrolepiota fuliginosa MF-IS2]